MTTMRKGLASRMVHGIRNALRRLADQPELAPEAHPNVALRIGLTRNAMLTTVGDAGLARHPNLLRKLHEAKDMEELWHLRPEWMAALSAGKNGEAPAASYALALNALFEDMVPASLLAAHAKRPPL